MAKHIIAIKTLLISVALTSSEVAFSKRVQIGYPSATALEEVRFSVSGFSSENGRKLRFIGECENCPAALYLPDDASIELSTGQLIEGSALSDTGLHEASFISFGEGNTVYSIKLK